MSMENNGDSPFRYFEDNLMLPYFGSARAKCGKPRPYTVLEKNYYT